MMEMHLTYHCAGLCWPSAWAKLHAVEVAAVAATTPPVAKSLGEVARSICMNLRIDASLL
jgi:hypothetical protein